MLKLSLKISAYFLLGALALLSLAYITLIIVNWRDKEPSNTVLEFQQFAGAPASIEDKDNGFVYVMGFDALKNKDPHSVGTARIAWTHEVDIDPVSNDPLNFPEESFSLNALRSPNILDIDNECRDKNESCLKALNENARLVHEWLESEQWLLDRYRALIDYPDWHENSYIHVNLPLPAYQHLMSAQRLYLMDAWRNAPQRDPRDIQKLLNKDLIFWRNVQKNSITLITKMVALSAIDKNFYWTNQIHRKTSVEQSEEIIPPTLNKQFSAEELSMYMCFVGEWLYSRSIFEGISEQGLINTGYYVQKGEESIFNSIVQSLAAPLLQRQDTLNRQAENLRLTAEVFSMPINQYPGIRNTRRQQEFPSDETWSLYNPIGKILLNISKFSYDEYIFRTSDIEGARRALLLTARLRRESIPLDGIQEYVDQAPEKNPYTDKPMKWDAENKQIIFEGLATGDRGKYAYAY